MTEKERIGQLDNALEARVLNPADPLLAIAAALTDAPAERFRSGLRRRIEIAAAQRSSHMTTTTAAPYVRPGYSTVTPFLIVPDANAFIDFVRTAFRAEELHRVPTPDGKVMHAEVKIGDSLLAVADATAQFSQRTLPLHLYVEDADAAYNRAIAAGAESLKEPVDQPYGDREASIRDLAGNNWYIATHRATGHKPAGLRSVTPYLHPEGAASLIAFLEQAFGAETLERYGEPNGPVHHAKLRLGDSILEMSDAHGPWRPMPGGIELYLEDVDAAYERAQKLGAESLYPPEDKPYGDRSAGVRDPHGNLWFLSRFTGER